MATKKQNKYCRVGEFKIGSWFKLGIDLGLLERHCITLLNNFRFDVATLKCKRRLLEYSLEDCVHYAKQFREVNMHMCGNYSTLAYNFEKEENKWCALASRFLEKRMLCLQMKAMGDDLPEEDEIDGRRYFPPAPLPKEWFQYENAKFYKPNIAIRTPCVKRHKCVSERKIFSITHPLPTSIIFYFSNCFVSFFVKNIS
jgi:hypothetical protein